MKRISGIVAAAMAALTIVSYSTAAAGAAQVMPCADVKVICSNTADCKDAEKLLEKLCNNNGCNLNDIIKSADCYCSVGKCSTYKPSVPQQQPTINPTQPTVIPEEPTVVPTQSLVKPEEPTVVPTQSPVKPEEPTVVPTQPTVPSQTDLSDFNTAYEAEVLKLVNEQRAEYGLSPLVQDNGATEVAHLRAKEIVQSFSHTRPNGSSCFTAADELGVSYRSAGENIAYGYATPEQVVSGWMNSEGHRKNILSSSFSKIGIGCYESRGVLYWSQFFIG